MTTSNKIDRTALAKVYAEVDIGAWEALLGGGHAIDDEGSDDERAAFDGVRTAVSELTGVPIDSIDGGTPLNALGVDSVRLSISASSVKRLTSLIDPSHPVGSLAEGEEPGARADCARYPRTPDRQRAGEVHCLIARQLGCSGYHQRRNQFRASSFQR